MTSDSAFQSKVTRYKDITFRSRLEVQWAYFMDSVGLRWVYEPQRLLLPNGSEYVPDFFLLDLKAWMEVKGNPTPETVRKPLLLWQALGEVDRKLIIALNDGDVFVPKYRANGTLAMDAKTVECASCHGVWFANLLDDTGHHCPHCGDQEGGLASLLVGAELRATPVRSRWIGSFDPLKYRDHIAQVA